MGIFTNKATRAAQDKLDKANDRIDGLLQTQELLTRKLGDILSINEAERGYVGNDYPSYERAVEAISAKYQGTADWGVLQTGTVIDLRAAFILGEGIQAVHTTDTKAEAERELVFAKDFIRFNELDAEMAQEIAKEAEIEGKVALRLKWDNNPYLEHPGMVTVRFISWTDTRYEIVADPSDYLWYRTLQWRPNTGAGEFEKIGEEEFVYKKFGGRVHDPNDAQPKVMKCLTQIDRLDKALRDLREINHLFASPTPDFELDDPIIAEKLLAQINNINWKIGKVIVHCGKFSLVSPDASGVANLLQEIETTTKLISGATGIPIHYLGYLDLLKNRSTGENTRELVMASTTRERMTWLGVYNELIEKAMAMYNATTGAGQKTSRLDPTRIHIDIPLITQDHFDRIEKVYIPAALGGIISKEAVAELIPGIDAEAEAGRREQAEESELERAKTDLDRIRAEQNLRGMGGEEE